MSIFITRFDSFGYHIWLNGQIGPPLNHYDAEVVVTWLNNTELCINKHSLFSYELVMKQTDEMYQIQDVRKPIGDPVKEKRDVVAIVNWLNSCIPELVDRLRTSFYTPIIGEDPLPEEIQRYMKLEGIGYYDALEHLRTKKYKKL